MVSWLVIAAALVVFPVLFFVPAPYGRHLRQGFGPVMPARLAWVVMESPSVFVFAWCFWTQSPFHDQPSAQLLAGLWLFHYLQRTFVFPLLMKSGGKGQPLLTVAIALAFNLVNASTNGAALAVRGLKPQLVAGIALFLAGLAINLHSDAVLRALREGDGGYSIPHGGLYRWVSCPNYLGELMEWVGFALAAWTMPALAFAIFTFANLFPRALTHHRWYRDRFPDYPSERKAIFPFFV
jgi:protein-S-isoprenylcysteine O-methyltransferase Ste14